MNAFDTPWFNSQDRSFFNTLNKSTLTHIVLTAETEDFADEIIQQWKDEGFNVVYVSLEGSGTPAQYVARVKATGEALGVSEQYAVVGNAPCQAYDVNRLLLSHAHCKRVANAMVQPSAMLQIIFSSRM